MINTDITILGVNLKSICMALLAKYYGFNTTLIDTEPLKDYPLNPVIGNYIRREPIFSDIFGNIDLPDLTQYRLSNFLQLTLETNYQYCTHKQFNAYAHFLLSQLKDSGYVQVIQEGIKSISNKGPITLSDNLIVSKATVICTEYIHLPKLPIDWCAVPANGIVVDTYIDSIKDISNQKVVVWGTDESQILSILYLGSRDNLVTWVIDKPYRVTLFDVPSEEEWGHKNAQGSYYATALKDNGIRDRYIQSVNKWQPSIHPTHEKEINKLIEVGKLLIIDKVHTPTSIIKSHVSEGTYFLPVPKRFITIKDIPYTVKPATYSTDSLFPLLNNNFMDTNKVYYMGYLSSRLDGIRQVSNIVNAQTGNLILQDIQNNYVR